MASVKSQTQREVESDFRLREWGMEIAGRTAGLPPGGLPGPGPGPDLAFGDQAPVGGVSMPRCICLCLICTVICRLTSHPLSGMFVCGAVLADTGLYVSILVLS
jgi:hypothetical protein